MKVSAQSVKALREETGAGMMECKRALLEARGDHASAVRTLRERGVAIAQRREERPTTAGRIALRITERAGVVVKLLCETDFVAMNTQFISLADRIAESVLQATGDYDGTGTYPAPWGDEVAEDIESTTARIRERIVLRSCMTVERRSDEVLRSYLHPDASVASIVRLRPNAPDARTRDDDIRALAAELALHIAATAPRFVDRESVPESYRQALRARYEQEARAAGKPENIVGKIVAGRLEKTWRSICLLDQPFVRNGDLTVSEFIAESGTETSVTGFAYDSVRDRADQAGIVARR